MRQTSRQNSNRITVAGALVTALAVGCTSSHRESSDRVGSPAPSADAISAEYPQLFWMCTLFEVPPDVEIAPDGTLRRAVQRGNGIAEIPAADITAAFASIQAYPGTRFIAAPAIVTQPGARGRIETHDRDKAGDSIGPRSIEVEGAPDAKGLAYELEIMTGPSTSCGTGARLMEEDRALLLLCRSDDASAPWTLLVVRPSILRTPADHVVQRAASTAER